MCACVAFYVEGTHRCGRDLQSPRPNSLQEMSSSAGYAGRRWIGVVTGTIGGRRAGGSRHLGNHHPSFLCAVGVSKEWTGQVLPSY